MKQTMMIMMMNIIIIIIIIIPKLVFVYEISYIICKR